MNIFRFIADMLHLAAILILIYRIRKSRNCIGKHHTCEIIDEIQANLAEKIKCLYRFVVQDSGIILDCILCEIS